MILLYAGILVVLSALNARLAGSYLYPPAVFSGVWAFIVGGIFLAGDFFYPVSISTLNIFIIGAVAFSAGGFLILLYQSRRESVSLRVEFDSYFIDYFLLAGLIILVLAFPSYLGRLQQIQELSGVDDFWIGLRWQSTYGVGEESSLGIFSYLSTIGTFLAVAAFYESDGTLLRRLRAVSLILIALTYHVLTVSRLGAMLLIFALAAVAFMKPSVRNLKVALALLLIFVVIFTIPALLLNKGGSLEAGVVDNLRSLSESFSTMAFGGPVAFEKVVADPEIIEERWLSLRFFAAFANAFGASYDVPAVVLDVVEVPAETNVYTFYVSYYRDFGLVGTAVIMFLLGIIFTWVYFKAISGNQPAIVIYSLIFAGMLVTNASDTFLIAISFWILAVAFVLALYYTPRLWASPVEAVDGGRSLPEAKV